MRTTMAERKRKLRLYNGRCDWMVVLEDKRWKKADRGHMHAYVAAYSVADACAVIEEYTGAHTGKGEINNFWNKGCWGNRMEGITPERGLWIQFNLDDGSVRVV